MRNSLFGVVVVLLLGGAQAFSIPWPKWGACPDLSVEQNFDVSKYMGIWFSHKTLNTDFTQGKGRCASANYTLNATAGVVEVFNQQIAASTNQWQNISGTAQQVNPEADEGRLVVTFFIKLWHSLGFTVTGPYWVLGTDYDSYSVVYGCKSILYFWHAESVWQLSRNQILTDDEKTAYEKNVNAVLLINNLDPTTFETVDQTNCVAGSE